MGKIYAYKLTVCENPEDQCPEYYVDRGIVHADSMPLAMEKLLRPYKETSDVVEGIELESVPSEWFDNEIFSVYGFLSDMSMFTDITHELKGWHLIKE